MHYTPPYSPPSTSSSSPAWGSPHSAASAAAASPSWTAGSQSPPWAPAMPAAIDSTAETAATMPASGQTPPQDHAGWGAHQQQHADSNGFGFGSGLQQRRGGGVGGGAPPTTAAATSAQTVSRPSAAAVGLDAPRTVAEFVRQLLTPRMITLLVALWLTFTLLAVPYLLWLSESATPITPPPGLPESDDAVFCRSFTEPTYYGVTPPALPAWQKSCLPCAGQARCGDDGRLRCDSDLLRVYHDCVQPSELNKKALQMKEATLAALQRHAGAVQCGDDAGGANGAPARRLAHVSQADLTRDELRQLLHASQSAEERDARSGTQAAREEDERVWAVASRWIAQEAMHVQQWSPQARAVRLLYVHTDSRQMPRYRAVYPDRSLRCRLSRTFFSSSFFTAATLGLLALLVISGAVLLHQFGQFVVQSRSLEKRLLELLRSDIFHDYDRHTAVHQPQAVAPLRAAHMARARAQLAGSSASSGCGRWLRALALRREVDALLQRCVWARAVAQLERHEHVQSAVSDFQYGAAPSWRWIGPAAISGAASTGPSALNHAAASPTGFQAPLSASRRPQPQSAQQRTLEEDEQEDLKHLHAL